LAIEMNTRPYPASAAPAMLDASTDERQPPPLVGLPLGPALGLTISLLVALLLGGLTAVQLHRDEQRARRTREDLLTESLAPLVNQVEGAVNLEEIARLLSASRLAELSLGRPDFNVVLRGADGRVLASSAVAGRPSPPEGSLHASVQVHPGAVRSGTASLVVWQDGSELASEMALRRREALFDIGVTVAAVVFVVQLTVFFLVSRPLRRLLTTIDKFEQGYPARFAGGFPVRELSWLEWRLQRMSVGLTQNARLLVAAHRRAIEASKGRQSDDFDPLVFDPLTTDQADPASENEIMRRYLSDRCAMLEEHRAEGPALAEVAVGVWLRDAPEAERLGESDLRARLENAALAVLDPGAFERVRLDLEAVVASRSTWVAETTKAIASALAEENIPHVTIQHRTKHVAGVWRKMQEKQLSIEEVHDLLAFRIIVPEIDHCYLALETVHHLFDPEPFRFKDYIAEPKANGYQSLHTSVRHRDGLVFEIQIRSVAMHRAAELGPASHWRYRAGKMPAFSFVGNIGRRGPRRWPRIGNRPSSAYR
jgi:ppGpp synthetase/RelA/SpoT-type nucleotidyltranferase